MRNMDWLIYTHRHRQAFRYCVEKLITDPGLRQRMLDRAEVHDMDKMVMYLFMDQHSAQLLHVSTQPHHLENRLPRSHDDLVETVIDYECAPYTKPDKPLNAYDFTHKLMKMAVLDTDTGEKLISIMRELGIARSGTVEEDQAGLAFCRCEMPVTQETILEEILRYVDENRDNALKLALEHADSSLKT